MDVIKQTFSWHDRIVKAATEADFHPTLRERIALAEILIREETKELLAEIDTSYGYHIDAPNIAKEAADVLFVVLQLMHTLNIPFEDVYAEVLRSNETKLIHPTFNRQGKLQKGASYEPADVERIFERKGLEQWIDIIKS
jgi:NTP pyrophosphatase (non-canonical NTP hydrolase)